AVVTAPAEHGAPDGKPLPAKRNGGRETALIALFPLALLLKELLG
ncbi:MAG: hypothetical protein H8E31_05300, partial [Planctomycetes bacterium]|nr:hypothetical protein [Planctomycetota bacterium]